MNFKELEGRKVTMFGLSEWGFPVTRQTTITEVNEVSRGYVEVIHRPKRKRKCYKKTIAPREEVYIFDGWIEINAEMFTETSPSGAQTSKACFDDSYITDGLKSAGQDPLIVINKAT